MATFDLGRVTPLYKGDYSASASYELNDVVLYNGNLYWHVQATATVGILPTDTTVWKLAFADEGVRAEIRGYADDAQTSKTAAAQSASQASASASSAQASASQAASSAQAASTKASEASTSAQTASTKASEATASAQSAASSAQTATDNATLATNKAQAASESASLATAKANAAATSETNAAASAQTATAKASEAAASATSAQEYDESAQASAVNAQTAQGLAETAQTAAETAQGLAEDARDLAQQYAESIDPEHIYSAYPTDTASGAIASFADGADDIPLKSLVVNIDPVQSGSGDPSPDNVRPISGWTGMTVSRTGINQWDEEWQNGFYGTTGDFTPNASYVACKNKIPVLPNTQYCISSQSKYIGRLCFYDADENLVSTTIGIGQSATTYVFTTQSNVHYMTFDMMSSYGTTYNHDISINYPSTDHDYHPYTGQTIPISWQTEAGTVYGGTLDVVSGVLTVDNGYKNKDNVEKKVYTLNGNNVWLMEYDAASTDSAEVSAISSVLKQGNYNDIYAGQSNIVAQNSQGRLLANVDGISSVSDIDTWLNANPDFLVVYKLATPITIQLTPHEVKSLLGANNIFADTGDSAVEYRADTKMYIERLTTPDSADMIADSNIVSGQYFMVGNSLYLATANIASGSAVIVGTNAIRKSLAQALNEINQ